MQKRFFKRETHPRRVRCLMITDLGDRIKMEIQHLKVSEEMGKQDLLYYILVDTQRQEFREDVTKSEASGRWQAFPRWEWGRSYPNCRIEHKSFLFLLRFLHPLCYLSECGTPVFNGVISGAHRERGGEIVRI